MLTITTKAEYERALERLEELLELPDFDEEDQEIVSELEDAIELYEDSLNENRQE